MNSMKLYLQISLQLVIAEHDTKTTKPLLGKNMERVLQPRLQQSFWRLKLELKLI